MGAKRIDWQDNWLQEHVLNSESYLKLTEEYNKTFGTNIDWRVIKSHCNNKLGIHKERKAYRHYTEEQLKFLSERYEKMGNRELLELFNSTFHENRTMSSMKNFGVQYHMQVDKSVRQINRRKRLDKDTSKRKTRNAGDTRIESGRLVMKDKNGDWKSAIRVVWEKVHGPVPKGYVVTALDGNCFNFALDNLICVPKTYLGLLLKHDLRGNDPEITKTGIMLCELIEAMKQQEKENQNEST